MATRRRIESASDIWEQALANTPIDKSGPQWSRPVSVWLVIAAALAANAAFSIMVVKAWNYLF